MPASEQLSELIGDIYDTALDGTRWVQVLKKAAGFIGGPSAAVWCKDSRREAGSFAHVWGFDSGYAQAYLDEYGKLDPVGRGHLFGSIGKLVVRSDLVSHNDFRETRFYREWARPQGLVDCIHIPLAKSDASVALFSVSRHRLDGIADEEACRRIRLLAPHIRRAVLVGKVADSKGAAAANFAEVLNSLRAAVVLVDVKGRVTHANIAGRAMLAEGSVVSRVGCGLLAVGNTGIDNYLRGIFASTPGGDTAVGTKGIAVPVITRGGERYVIHVLPLTSGLRCRAGCSHEATAALFVHPTSLTVPSPPEVIAKSYDLTPAELRVLLAVVEIGGVPDVAEALGISATTVKTHLGRIYGKTGTRRQADLVKLVAGFTNPLLG